MERKISTNRNRGVLPVFLFLLTINYLCDIQILKKGDIYMEYDNKCLEELEEALYRMPMPVKQTDTSKEPVCPRCGKSLLRLMQKFCNHCGQKLAWNTQKN